MTINIQSILSKKEVLWESLDYYDPDIIFGCETWLNKSVLDNEILPPSYKLYRNDRSDGYGGVLIGVKVTLASHLISIHPHLEVCTVSVQLINYQQLILICVYRPPNIDSISLMTYVIMLLILHKLTPMPLSAVVV